MNDSNAMPPFRQYQLQFAAHIRDPQHEAKPAKVDASRMKVYRDIVFHGLESSLAGCFPVAKRVLGKRLWQKLVRGFLVAHRSRSPLFRQIPEEFLRYLQECEGQVAGVSLPAFLPDLAHYEWMELALASAEAEAESDMAQIDADGDLLAARPVLTAASALLSYAYPVHRISPRFKPQEPLAESVQLLIFRDSEWRVHFIEINALTARLLTLLQSGELSGRQALLQLADETGQTEPQAMLAFGAELLQALKTQGVLLGTRVEPA
ncbi:MAG: putative DNA-binding domain-containing protein [Methylophilaceae bacterium]|jgi:hypothetical protein|nr:putative DNA-binding domain-containing protein [Methylophilaceae bacterium]